MGTAVGDALDYLVTTVLALPECADPVVVADGYTSKRANTLVTIGVTEEDGQSEVTAAWAGLGASREDEQFEIPCLIEVYKGGGDEAVSTARAAAIVLFDAINAAIRADRSLGGALNSPGRAQIAGHRLVQTNSPEDAAEGRHARIYFAVHCTSRF